MTRTWISDSDHRWVMQCDQTGCDTRFGPFDQQPDLALFPDLGWFVAALFGDICPACLAAGTRPKATVEPWRGIVPAAMTSP